MQHNPQKPNRDYGSKEINRHELNTDSQFDMHNVFPKQMHVQDVCRGTDDPDNIRRQKQDYFDNWEITSSEFLFIKRLG